MREGGRRGGMIIFYSILIDIYGGRVGGGYRFLGFEMFDKSIFMLGEFLVKDKGRFFFFY